MENKLSLDLMMLANQIGQVFRDVQNDIRKNRNYEPYKAEAEAHETFERCAHEMSRACRTLGMRLNRAALAETPENLPENKIESVCERLENGSLTRELAVEAARMIELLALSLSAKGYK